MNCVEITKHFDRKSGRKRFAFLHLSAQASSAFFLGCCDLLTLLHSEQPGNNLGPRNGK